MRRGEAAAFALFVDSHAPKVQTLARRFARCEADAEDLTQEIFVELCRSVASFRGDSALTTWVYRVAWNHCAKHAERRKPENLPMENMPLVDADPRQNPETFAARRELAAKVEDAMGTLTEAHRETVLLHEFHGLTYAECAHILGVPVGTVKSRLSNAFQKLRTNLSGYVEGETEKTPCGANAKTGGAAVRAAHAPLPETGGRR